MTTAWAPTPEQVKALMPSRVNYQPFAADTNPTVAQVLLIIEQVVVEIRSEVGSFDPDKITNPTAPVSERMTLGEVAGWAAQLGTAYYVEQGFFPEQNDTAGEDSPAARFRARYTEQTARLASIIAELAADEGDRDAGFVGTMYTPKLDRGCRVPDARLPPCWP